METEPKDVIVLGSIRKGNKKFSKIQNLQAQYFHSYRQKDSPDACHHGKNHRPQLVLKNFR